MSARTPRHEAGLTFEKVRILRAGAPLLELDAHIPPGEILTVMGPSGAGKSTLLAFATGTLDPAFTAEGRLWLDGEEITRRPPQTRRIGMLFQDDVLFPHLSVAGNLAFGLAPQIRGRAARRARIEAALAEAGLSGFGPRDPATLSGGQRARVALLRTLLAEPRALALDEPFSRLDASRRARTRDFVFSHARACRLPTLLVTHDAEDAMAAGGPTLALGG